MTAKIKKPKKTKGVGNDDRRNRKAWKKRPCCGKRHSPDRCK